MKKVLLIDNDPEFLHNVARGLLARGYQVTEAHDGLEGIERALEDPPDVAVVDLIMPRVGGSEVVSFFKRNAYLASLPIVLLTGVLIEDSAMTDALDVDMVLMKGPVEETIRLLLAGLEQVGDGGRGR